HQARRLKRLIPSLKKRLTLDRRLARANILDASLAVALDAIGSPAYIIDGAGHILERNTMAAQIHEGDQRSLHWSLAQATKRPELSRDFTMTRIVAAGCPDHFLAVARAAPETRLRELAAAAAKRWSLTLRQQEILRGVMAGITSRAIAADLGISERTVEVHLTAIFARAQVESRAELIVKAWRIADR
ncbi:MAG: helix-turn-helix transcriptional regulator, partial [Polyangiaceae bacterium]